MDAKDKEIIDLVLHGHQTPEMLCLGLIVVTLWFLLYEVTKNG